MHSAKLFVPAAIILMAGACGKPDHSTTDTTVPATAAGPSAQASSSPAPQPTLTSAPTDTAKPSPAATQSGAAKPAATSSTPAPRATTAAAETATAGPAAPAPRLDSAREAKPAATPTPAPATPAAPTPAPTLATAAATTTATADSLGKPAYDANCRRCHGVRGVPPRTMAAKYPKIPTFDAAFVAKVPADSIVNVLTRGVNDDMKSFKDKLTRDEMRAVAAYVRGFAR